MSFRVMDWASKQKTGSPTRKLILLMLADRANDKGYCWPSLKTIAEDCELKKDAVIRNIKKLEDGGFLTVIRREKDGVSLPNHYQLNMDGPEVKKELGVSAEQGVVAEKDYWGTASSGVVVEKDQGSSSEIPGVVAEKDPNLSIEPVIEPKKESTHIVCTKERKVNEAERANAPRAQKRDKFSFNLPTKQPYSKLSEAYRRSLFGYAITKDGAEQFQSFIDHHAAKGTAFKDWAAAYRTWLKNEIKYGGTVSMPFQAVGKRGETVFLDYTQSWVVVEGDESYTPRQRIVKKAPPEEHVRQEEPRGSYGTDGLVGCLAEKIRVGGN